MVNCRFFNNTCDSLGPDVGGGAVRAFSQYQNLPVYVVNCTFGGKDGYGNFGANGGAISSIGVSSARSSTACFHITAPSETAEIHAKSGTPGGGSGGAIYNDGNTMTLSLCGCLLEFNQVNAYGSAIFFVTDDMTGNMSIENSVIRDNIGGSWYALPGISMLDATRCDTVNSTIE